MFRIFSGSLSCSVITPDILHAFNVKVPRAIERKESRSLMVIVVADTSDADIFSALQGA